LPWFSSTKCRKITSFFIKKPCLGDAWARFFIFPQTQKLAFVWDWIIIKAFIRFYEWNHKQVEGINSPNQCFKYATKIDCQRRL